MIRDVRKDGFTPNDIPWRFEAGTPPIAEAIGLGAAVDYLRAVGMEAVREHEMALTAYALAALHERFGDDLRIFGPPRACRPGRRASPSPTGTSIRTTSPRSSTSTGSASGPVTTAPSP